MNNSPSDASFPATRWSIIARVREDSEARNIALDELCKSYRGPLYAFARRSGRSAADAEDLVQGFLAKALSEDLFRRADEDSGKLRTFLLTLFRRYEKDQRQREFAQKRGGGKTVSLEMAGLEDWYASEESGNRSAEEFFDRRWAVSVLENSVSSLANEWKEKGRAEEFAQLRPYLTESGSGEDFARIAGELGVKPESVKVKIHRLRARFGLVLRDEVAQTLHEPGEIDDEMRYLVSLL